LQQNNLEAASRLYEQALKHAPHDKEAQAGLKLIDHIKSGKVDRKAVLDQLDSGARKTTTAEKNGKIERLTAEQVIKLAQIGDDKAAKPGADQAKDNEAALKAYRDNQILQEQKLTQTIEQDIRFAKTEMNSDPDGAYERLRMAL